MFMSYIAKYTKLQNGYMGQLIDWPEVITEGENLEDCRLMLQDALSEMARVYKEMKMEFPRANCLIEQLPVEIDDVGQTA
jgi:predicted RNase H-like HicB family nuclease